MKLIHHTQTSKRLFLLFVCYLGFWMVNDQIVVGQGLQVGFSEVDITPTEPVPMWGYGDRHATLSEGTLDPLKATAIVIQAGKRKLAIVGLDLGRAPQEASS